MAKKFEKNNSISAIMNKATNSTLNVNSEKIYQIDINKIIENENNKFSMNTDDVEFKILVESVKRIGVTQPVLLKEIEGGYYKVIAGHRRLRASKINKLPTIPSIIREYNNVEDNEILDLVETNLSTRKLTVDDILASIELIEDIVKNDNVKIEGKTSEYIGKMLNMSGRQVERYKALNNLTPELKEKVDSGDIGISTVTPIATMTQDDQKIVAKEIDKIQEETKKPVTRETTQEIKKAVESVKLAPEVKEAELKTPLTTVATIKELPQEEQKEAVEEIKKIEEETKKPVPKDEVKKIVEKKKEEIKDKPKTEEKAQPQTQGQNKNTQTSKEDEKKEEPKETDRTKEIEVTINDLEVAFKRYFKNGDVTDIEEFIEDLSDYSTLVKDKLKLLKKK